MATVGLGGSEEDEDDVEEDIDEDESDNLLGPDLETEEATPPPPWALVLPLLELGGSGGDTWEPGWCSEGKLGRMQLTFRSLVLTSCCCWWPPLLPNACNEQAERWYESTSRCAADWKAGW